VDFKSDAAGDQADAAAYGRYAAQVTEYGLALSLASGGRVVRSALLFTINGLMLWTSAPC
jgi:ATP-dependent exoDNAse (exonuclease V) beta subunit